MNFSSFEINFFQKINKFYKSFQLNKIFKKLFEHPKKIFEK